MGEKWNDIKVLSRQDSGTLQTRITILGQCSLECFYQVRTVFKKLEKEGVKFDRETLRRVSPQKVASGLLSAMECDFSLDSLQFAYKALWDFGSKEDIDEALNWEDAFCSTFCASEISEFLVGMNANDSLEDIPIEKSFPRFSKELWGGY